MLVCFWEQTWYNYCCYCCLARDKLIVEQSYQMKQLSMCTGQCSRTRPCLCLFKAARHVETSRPLGMFVTSRMDIPHVLSSILPLAVPINQDAGARSGAARWSESADLLLIGVGNLRYLSILQDAKQAGQGHQAFASASATGSQQRQVSTDKAVASAALPGKQQQQQPAAAGGLQQPPALGRGHQQPHQQPRQQSQNVSH